MKNPSSQLSQNDFKQVKIFILGLILLFSFCLFLPSSLLAQQKLVISTFNIKSVTIPLTFAVLKEAYKRNGIEIALEKLPGKRALISSNSGKTDGELLRVKGIQKQFSNLVIVPVPVYHVKIVAITHQKKIQINGVQSLKQYKLGILRGMVATEKLTNGMNRHEVNSAKSLFSILKRGRIDAAIYLRADAEFFISTSPELKGLKILEPPLLTTTNYHFLNKKHQTLVPKITATLEDMEKTGTIKKIQEQVFKKLIGGDN